MVIEEVELRLGHKNKILFTRDSPVLGDLARLLDEVDKKVAVLWALDLSGEIVVELDHKYPQIELFDQSLNLAYQWLQGMVKMPAAKKAILELHGLAKVFEQEPATMADGLKIRGLAHGLSSIHSKKHAIGLPVYFLSALVYLEPEGYETAVKKAINAYFDRLEYYRAHVGGFNVHWAKFLDRS